MKFIATLAALTAGIVLSVTPAAARTFDASDYEAWSRDRHAQEQALAAEARQREDEMQRRALENSWRANDIAERNLCRGTALCDNAVRRTAGTPPSTFSSLSPPLPIKGRGNFSLF